ncbi:hypothetical protein LCL87_25055 [Rhodococcus hoagii]|nr:hypothetical protein [Prescottella equi]
MVNLIDNLQFLVGAGVGVGVGDPTDPPADPVDPPVDPVDPVDPPADPPADDPKDDETDWKAMARKHERDAKANRAAAVELEKLKQAQMTDAEKQAAAVKATEERAAAAEAKAAVLEAALEHGITDKKDLELLAGLPADKVAPFAKRIAAQKAPAGRSGNPVDGEKPKPKPTTLTGAIGAHYA